MFEKLTSLFSKQEKEGESEMVATLTKESHKSRWGYHPCDYETFLKLKKLKKYYWMTVYRNAQWKRWNAKLPHNRVIKRKGIVISQMIEPLVCSVMLSKNSERVLEDFENARMPQANPESVKPLRMPLEWIDETLKKCEDCYLTA
jgi:hypothetical protein